MVALSAKAFQFKTIEVQPHLKQDLPQIRTTKHEVTNTVYW